MNQLSLFLFSILLFVGFCHAINCNEVKSILNIEYEGSCCDLQQVNCDANENILSIETLLEIEGEREEEKQDNKLYARKIHKSHSSHHHYNSNNNNDNYNDTSSNSDSFVSTNVNKYNVYISLIVLMVLMAFL